MMAMQFFVYAGVLLQFFLLNKTTLVLVNDVEGLCQLCFGFVTQTTGSEELLVAEGVSS